MSTTISREQAEEAIAVAVAALAEARYDTAVDRAYFAMFHAARLALFASSRVGATNLKSHRAVLVSFSELVIKAGLLPAEFGRDINAVQRMRHVSDYSDRHVSSEEAAEAVGAASRFCDAVFELLQRPEASS